jgi:hypothetical protein
MSERLWLEGLGWIVLGRVGQKLERCLVDVCVGSPERLVFEAAPVVERPLAQRPRVALAFEGRMIDTSRVFVPLTADDDQLGNVTVGDLLADPHEFEGETLSDPLEGPAYGRCKAMVMVGSDGDVSIHSFAHGRTFYRCLEDHDTLKAAIEASALREPLNNSLSTGAGPVSSVDQR